jgi:hypothetical protein
MPKRRRAIGRGLSAAADALTPLIQSLLLRQQGEQVSERQMQIDLMNRKQALEDAVAGGTREPNQASAMWKGQTGLDQDFAPFQPSVTKRAGTIGAEIGAADTLSKLMTPEAVKRRTRDLNIPTDMIPGQVFPEQAEPGEVQAGRSFGMVENPDLASLMNERTATEQKLTAQAPRIDQDYADPNTGLPRRRRILSTAESDVAAGPTPEQTSALTGRGLTADETLGIPTMKGRQVGQGKVAEITTAGPVEAQQAGRVAGAQAGAQLGVESSPQALDLFGQKAAITANAQPPTAPQSLAYDYATRTAAAHDMMMQLEPQMIKRGGFINFLALKNFDAIKDPTTRAYVTAVREFINSTLRRESGAAISPAEFDQADKQYSLTAGESPETLKYKQSARRRTIQGMAGSAGPKLGALFVTLDELQAVAAQRGVPIDEVLSQARAEGIRVIR